MGSNGSRLALAALATGTLLLVSGTPGAAQRVPSCETRRTFISEPRLTQRIRVPRDGACLSRHFGDRLRPQVTIIDRPRNGVLAVEADPRALEVHFIYRPAAGYVGPDRFAVTITIGELTAYREYLVTVED